MIRRRSPLVIRHVDERGVVPVINLGERRAVAAIALLNVDDRDLARFVERADHRDART
jgi:hypothetical protein